MVPPVQVVSPVQSVPPARFVPPAQLVLPVHLAPVVRPVRPVRQGAGHRHARTLPVGCKFLQLLCRAAFTKLNSSHVRCARPADDSYICCRPLVDNR